MLSPRGRTTNQKHSGLPITEPCRSSARSPGLSRGSGPYRSEACRGSLKWSASGHHRLAVSDGGEILRHVASGLKPLPPLKFTDEAVHALTVRIGQIRKSGKKTTKKAAQALRPCAALL